MKFYLLVLYFASSSLFVNCIPWVALRPVRKNGFHAIIRHRTRNLSLCRGIIISENFVLTSSRCVYDRVAKEISVMYGSEEVVKTIGIDSIELHPDFQSTSDKNDIALLWIELGIEIIPDVTRFVELPLSCAKDDIYVIASDWGILSVCSLAFHYYLRILYSLDNILFSCFILNNSNPNQKTIHQKNFIIDIQKSYQ